MKRAASIAPPPPRVPSIRRAIHYSTTKSLYQCTDLRESSPGGPCKVEAPHCSCPAKSHRSAVIVAVCAVVLEFLVKSIACRVRASLALSPHWRLQPPFEHSFVCFTSSLLQFNEPPFFSPCDLSNPPLLVSLQRLPVMLAGSNARVLRYIVVAGIVRHLLFFWLARSVTCRLRHSLPSESKQKEELMPGSSKTMQVPVQMC